MGTQGRNRRAHVAVGLLAIAGVLSTATAHAGSVSAGAASASEGSFGLMVDIGRDCVPGLIVTPGLVNTDQTGCDSLEANGVRIVAPGATFKAGNSIHLGNAFSVDPGVPFAALIEPLVDSPYAFVEDTSPNGDRTYNARFDLRLNTLDLAVGDEIGHLNGYAANGNLLFSLMLRRNASDTGNELVPAARDDATGTLRRHPSPIPVSGGFHRAHVSWRTGMGDGRFTVAIGSGMATGLTDLDNDGQLVELVRWGAVDGPLVASTGSMDLDEFSSFRSELHETQVQVASIDPVSGERFGRAVAIDGHTAVIGDPDDGDGGPSGTPGAAYVHVRDNNRWTFRQKLTASDGENGDEFGDSVAISGDFIVVGAPRHDSDDTPLPNSGAVYIFKRDGLFFQEVVKLLPGVRPDGTTPNVIRFGWAVAIDSSVPEENSGAGVITTVVVGAPSDRELFHSGPHNSVIGAIHLFTESADGTAWNRGPRLELPLGGSTGPCCCVGPNFGDSVAIAGDALVVGAPRACNGNDMIGHALLYTRGGSLNNWGARFLFEASDAGVDDRFGGAVAVSPDGRGNFNVLVGAPMFDDPGPAVSNNNAGVAYAYHGNTNLWTERKLIPHSPDIGGQFGREVALNGFLAAISEPIRDTPARIQDGLVHVFRFLRDGVAERLGFLESSGPTLGQSVDISGETVIAGAPSESVPVGAGTLQAGAAHVYELNASIFTDGFESGDLSRWSAAKP